LEVVVIDRLIRLLVAGLGAVTLLSGLWAFFAPESFFEVLATFEPYNRHFIHDVGAFQIGLGVMLLGALVWKDSLLTVLVAYGVASVMHAISHWVDRDLGGNPSIDLPGLFGLAALVVAATIVYSRIRADAARPRRFHTYGSSGKD
jgi:hypothetical protein